MFVFLSFFVLVPRLTLFFVLVHKYVGLALHAVSTDVVIYAMAY